MPPQQPLDQIPIPDDDLRLAVLNKAVADNNLGVDSSSAGDDMTPVGMPIAERVGATFGGAADYLRRAEANWRSGDSQGTILAWIKPDAIDNGAIFASCDELAAIYYFAFYVDTYLYIGQRNFDVQDFCRSTAAIAVDQWQRVALVSTGTEWLFYINGQLTPTIAVVTANTGDWLAETQNRDSITIGAQRINIVYRHFDGQIKDVRYYSRPLEAHEIAYDYRRGVPDDYLRLWTVGGMTDLSRFVRVPTHIGGVICGHQAFFDGIDGRIDWGDIGNIQAVSLWIDPETTTEEILLVDTGNDIMVNGGVVTYTGLTPTATYVDGVATTAMVADKWQHLVCVFAQIDANNFEQGWDGANYGNTDQRDLRVYDRIPSADEVRLLYDTTRREY